MKKVNLTLLIVCVFLSITILFIENVPEKKIHYYRPGDCYNMWGNYTVGSSLYNDQMSLPEKERIPVTQIMCINNHD